MPAPDCGHRPRRVQQHPESGGAARLPHHPQRGQRHRGAVRGSSQLPGRSAALGPSPPAYQAHRPAGRLRPSPAAPARRPSSSPRLSCWKRLPRLAPCHIAAVAAGCTWCGRSWSTRGASRPLTLCASPPPPRRRPSTSTHARWLVMDSLAAGRGVAPARCILLAGVLSGVLSTFCLPCALCAGRLLCFGHLKLA